MDWYTWNNGVQRGPIAEGELRALAGTAELPAEALVWRPGLEGWQPWRQALGPPPGEPAGRCARCGNEFGESELAEWGGAVVCAWCKPRHLAALREGGDLPGRPPYAGWGVRLVARLMDGIIMGVVNTMVQLPVLIAGPMAAGTNPDLFSPTLFGVAYMVVMLVQIALQVGYETWFTYKKGGTPGKLMLDIRVTDGVGGPLTLGRAFGRTFAQWLTSLSLGLGYLTPLWDPEKRALHDMVADTRVVAKERSW